MRDVSVPAWVVVAVAAGLLLVVGGLVVALLRARRRIARRLDAAHAEAEELRHQVEEIRRRLEEPAPVRDAQEYVITGLGGFETGTNAPSSTTGDAPSSTTGVPMVPAPLFADMVLRESVLQAAALAAGLRRALSPESRNRIRFEMRREVKRARKQRRADLRAARREWEARQRSRVDLDEEGSAA